jgi:radical SAM protein with 4Fe4S-binding SPASM domain
MGLSQKNKKRALRISYTDLFPISLWERLKLFFKIRYKYPLDLPRQFWIEVTNECNLRCIMCPVSVGLKRRKATMVLADFVKIIDKIYMNKPRIMLHVAGEPLLNKDLFDMIGYAKDKGCWVGIHTNATLLTKEMSTRILESSLNFISFSFDGVTSEAYEKVRVGARFDQVRSQIETFLKLRTESKRKSPFTRIEILIMQETKTQISDFVEYWRTKEIDRVAGRLAGTWGGLVGSSGSKKLWRFGHKPCRDIFHKCAILVDGTVVPCCNDIQGRLPLGNILHQPFEEIWQGQQYANLRQQHLKNTVQEKSICYDCVFRRSWSRSEQITQWLLKQFFWRKYSI